MCFAAVQGGEDFSPIMSPTSSSKLDVLPDNVDRTVTVRMASLCYTHSPAFLRDFMQSLDDFKDYMSNVGKTLRHAAAEAAMGWVHKRTDLSSMSVWYGSTTSLDIDSSKRRGTLDDTISFQEEDPTVPSVPSRINFDIVLQSPVIMLPRKPNSPEVLVGHLGNISIRNSPADIDAWGAASGASTPAATVMLNNSSKLTERIHMEIRDMSVYSVNLEKQREEIANSSSKYADVLHGPLDTSQSGLLARNSCGTPVLHDTVIQLTIQKIEPTPQYINPPDTTLDFDFGGEEFSFKGNSTLQQDQQSSQEEASVLKVKGKIVSPLKLVLSKFVYEQILHTLDNITPPDEEEETFNDLPSPTLQKEKNFTQHIICLEVSDDVT